MTRTAIGITILAVITGICACNKVGEKPSDNESDYIAASAAQTWQTNKIPAEPAIITNGSMNTVLYWEVTIALHEIEKAMYNPDNEEMTDEQYTQWEEERMRMEEETMDKYGITWKEYKDFGFTYSKNLTMYLMAHPEIQQILDT